MAKEQISASSPLLTKLHLMFALLLAPVLLIGAQQAVRANGIPVQVFLDHLPFKTTWEPASNGRGVAVVASNDEQVRVMVKNLPQPPAGSVYYAWLEKAAGGYLSVGALNYLPEGTASIDQNMPDLPYSENFAWVLVTVEQPSSIGPEPSADIALAGRLPNPLAIPATSSETPEMLPVTGGESTWSPTALLLIAMVVLASVVIVTGYSHRRHLLSLQLQERSVSETASRQRSKSK